MQKAEIQNGLGPVTHAKNKEVFFVFLMLVLEQREKKRKDNPVILDELCDDNM